MYMLPVDIAPRSRTLRGLGQMTSTPGVSKAWCDARGGSYDQTTAPYGMPYGSGGSCHYMVTQPVATEAPYRAPAPAPSVSVPTTTTIQVSPQISPIFTQQFQPTGSPVGAATTMQQPDLTKFYEAEAARRAEESARQAELMERLFAAREPGAPPPMPQPMMEFLPGAPDEAMPTPPAGPGAGPGVPGLFAFGRGGSMLPLLAAAAIIGVVAMGGKGKSKRKAKRR